MNKDVVIRNISYAVLLLLALCGAYFIIHNAQWLLGDDAIVMRFTGWGEFFPLSHTVQPACGRFFPLAYTMYNILPIFFHGQISATIIYTYHAMVFVAFVFMAFYLVQDILKNQSAVWRYVTALLATIFLIGRHYSNYINCYSTVWFTDTINLLCILMAYLFYTRHKWVYGIFALITINWINYCSEVSFVVPLAWGVCAMLLWSTSSKKEKIFHILLIISALIFLVIYFFGIFLRAEGFYDGAHGAETTMLENAWKIFFAQKFLWMVMLVFCVRTYDIIRNHTPLTIYDILILTALADCCGGFILRLNWVLYYNRAIVIALPAVIYFVNQYLKPHWGTMLMFVFAIWYGIKVPKIIKSTNTNRIQTYQLMSEITHLHENGKTLYFYQPDATQESFDMVLRDWMYASLQTYAAYLLQQKDYTIERTNELQQEDAIYISSKYNATLSPEGMKLLENTYEPILRTNSQSDISIWGKE
ncbi:MAG: hypothetical protein ACI4TV_03250 [Paludibacteraceae bacterium]